LDYFLQQVLNALALGGTYALIAIGLAMVFSVLGLINFAHGELMTIMGYALFYCLAVEIPFVLSLAVALSVTIAAALLMELLAFRSVRNADIVVMLLTSFAISSILHVAFQNLLGARPKPIAVPDILVGAVKIAGLTFGKVPLFSIVTSAVSLLLLTLFLKRTIAGIAMRAAAQNFRVTRLMGINANRVILLAFALSGLLAGIAGVLWIFQRGSVDPAMGSIPAIKAFIAVVLGGLGSLPGAAAGGLILGALEVFLRAYLPDALLPFRDAISLSIVIGIFTVKPQGLFGKREAVR
jgi:branched-chain amino acid transport system permease protein